MVVALLIIVVLSLILVLTLSYTSKILDHFRHVLLVLWSVELLGRCLDFHEISDQIDFVTVYFVV